MAKRFIDEFVEANENVNPKLTENRSRGRRLRVDPGEREDYQEWLAERQDPKRRKVKPRRRRRARDLEPGF